MRTTLKQTLAGAWMLLAALALSTAGCSQLEDTPDAPSVATGNEPISISIAPKPGFEAGDAATRSIIQAEAQTRSNDAQTRSTVGDDGAFAWEGAEDFIFVVLTFSFADGTTAPLVKEQQWLSFPTGNSTDTPVILNWEVFDGWTGTTKIDPPMTWPLGAKSCTVQAFHTNCGYNVADDGSNLTDFTYAKSGQGDHMIFNGTFSVGETLAVNFAHSTTRVTFTGLKPGTTYRLQLNGTEPTLHDSFKKEGFTFAGTKIVPFTTDDKGTFTRCLPLTNYINPTSGEVKFKLLTVDLTTGVTPITEGALKAQATGSTPAWKTNGLQYIMTAKDFAGGNNPDTAPDLLIPAPIVPGAKVHELNGYYITQPDVDSERLYQWASVKTATKMENDPCEGYGNWRMPTMKDFEAIAGWTTNNPFNASNIINGSTTNPTTTLSKPVTFYAAFSTTSGIKFWSSERHTLGSYTSYALAIEIASGNKASYYYHSKTANGLIRCVQKK